VRFNVVRASLFAAVLIVIGGYELVYRPLDSAIASRYTDLDTARTTLERSLAFARRIPVLANERTALEVQLRRVHVRDRRDATVERFLRDLAAVAVRDDVSVQSITADARQSPLAAVRPAQSPLFDELALDLTLRGRYGEIIRAVRELNAADVATRITLASMSDAERRPGEQPPLNAAFHVILLREADDSSTRIARAR
jgi:hypothetical protein